MHHDRTNRIEVDLHFMKAKIGNVVNFMTYVPTLDQAADQLTKGLFKLVFENLVDKLGMFNVF